ncbi:MAG: dTMP kinase [Alphaproteobacteria bacterium]
MSKKPGVFITFEGGEGTGKSTQIQRLRDFLNARQIPHQVTREPGGVPSAERIRELLLNAGIDWAPVTEALLMSAARHEHVRQLILPALQQGEWVICDRFADSTSVYQGYAHGLGVGAIQALNKFTLGDLLPDLTFVFQLPASQGLARKKSQPQGENRFEQMELSFHERVQAGYTALLQAEPNRCIAIDATQPIETMATLIQEKIIERFF